MEGKSQTHLLVTQFVMPGLPVCLHNFIFFFFIDEEWFSALEAKERSVCSCLSYNMKIPKTLRFLAMLYTMEQRYQIKFSIFF